MIFRNKVKVGITGQSGFMGSHLYHFLSKKKEEIILNSFHKNYFDNPKQLSNFVKLCDVIVHIAGANRAANEQLIYDTNTTFTKRLIEVFREIDVRPKIIFASSTQETRNNAYGKSKRCSRKLLEKWARDCNGSVTSFIIPNVFGPFGKPFYNSFIATFCYQIIRGESPNIIQDSSINLIYVKELCQFFYKEIISHQKNITSVEIMHTSSKKVSEIRYQLKKYHKMMQQESLFLNENLSSFDKNLLTTFKSYLKNESIKDYNSRRNTS